MEFDLLFLDEILDSLLYDLSFVDKVTFGTKQHYHCAFLLLLFGLYHPKILDVLP